MANLESISTFIYKFQKSQPQLSFMTHNCRPIIHTCWFFNTIKKLLKFLKNIDLFLLFKISIWSSMTHSFQEPSKFCQNEMVFYSRKILLHRVSYLQVHHLFEVDTSTDILLKYLTQNIPIWYISFLNRILFFHISHWWFSAIHFIHIFFEFHTQIVVAFSISWSSYASTGLNVCFVKILLKAPTDVMWAGFYFLMTLLIFPWWFWNNLEHNSFDYEIWYIITLRDFHIFQCTTPLCIHSLQWKCYTFWYLVPWTYIC